MSKSKSWKQLIIAGLIGAVFTGVTQYLLIQATHSSYLESVKIAAKRELLVDELKERKKAYFQIREDFVKFFRSKNEEDKESLLISLEGNIPFIFPRYPTQDSVVSAKKSATKSALIWIEQTNSEKMLESERQLEKAFQDDLDRIQKLIDDL